MTFINNTIYLFSALRRKFSAFLLILLSVLLSPIAVPAEVVSHEEVGKLIKEYSHQLEKQPKKTDLYVKRGDLYLQIYDFELAVEDYDHAIELDPKNYQAYYGRGLANGRRGFIKAGINDLSVYIKQHPKNSMAYTKRGVRYLWLGDRENAGSDLNTAIKLDPNNAEAHDDLGVVLAQKQDYEAAIEHFNRAIAIDPSYQKAYHNLAMSYYLLGLDPSALQSVEMSLKLLPEARNSMLLKGLILKALGRGDEAEKVKEDALFLPEGSWHERAPVE